MTLNQYLHHAEQMEAARDEFRECFEKYKETAKWHRLSYREKTEIEICQWKIFLNKKGLAK